MAGQQRKAVIVAICEQPDPHDMGMTLEAMRLPLQALGLDIIEEFPILGVFDKAAVKDKQDVMAQAATIGQALAYSL